MSGVGFSRETLKMVEGYLFEKPAKETDGAP
jgi:hypothetical protein